MFRTSRLIVLIGIVLLWQAAVEGSLESSALASGHGGQTWVSTSTASAVRSHARQEKDLVTPVMTDDAPAAGKRVRQVAPEYKGTQVYHALHLPVDWKPGGRYPVLVEYTGNKFPPGKGSGEVKDANLGYGMSGGRGFIWVTMPYIQKGRKENAVTWWGDKQATVDYCKINLPRICRQFGGDPDNLFICGFSRGAIAASYIGLADDEIAAFWKGAFTHDHFDGHKMWGYPECDRASALQRLARLKGRPVLICGQHASAVRDQFLKDHLDLARFTFLDVPTTKIFAIPEGPYLHPHTDLWMHRESSSRQQARAWLQNVLSEAVIEPVALQSPTSRADEPRADAMHSVTTQPTPPNILILYADDLGYGDVQCYNQKRGEIPTPNVDRLAAQGMRFTDGHTSSGVCSPSRYTLLTGRYHWRSRLQSGIVGLWGAPLITPDRWTVGTLAKQRGYRTACIGKWHLGWNWPIPAGKKKWFQTGGYGGKKDISATDEHRAAWQTVFSQAIPGGPVSVGFDEYFGTDVPNWPPYCFIENDRTVGIPSEFAPPRLFLKNLASIQGPALADWTLEPILPTLGKRAAAFIEREAATPEPFLLYLPFTSPHTPLSVNESWKDKSGLNRYADFVMETDAVIGQVLEALEASGAAEDTLVVFTSDNGCAPYIGVEELEKQGHYPSGPLRGYKSDAWEGGHRVPFVVRWPGVTQPGSSCDQLVHQADLMATFADILGITLPEDAGEDSFSLLPLLKGDTHPARETSVSCSMRGVPSLRRGAWKYIAASGSGGWSKGGDPNQPVQIYDLAQDLGETKNLAAENPERVATMQKLLEQLITNGRSTPGTPQKNDVKVRRFGK